jgi:hypothetical protein
VSTATGSLAGGSRIDWTSFEGVVRAMELDQKFHSLEVWIVGGVLAALAERLRIYRVLIDHQDFGPLRVGERYAQRLEVVP